MCAKFYCGHKFVSEASSGDWECEDMGSSDSATNEMTLSKSLLFPLCALIYKIKGYLVLSKSLTSSNIRF